MIVNPFQHKQVLTTYAGTRILQEDFGLIGAVLPDPFNKFRMWRVHALYAPTGHRAVDGIRVKLVDDKNFMTFINQMDFEVLIGRGKPGAPCRWSGRKYSEPGDHDFYGMFVDDDDLTDDLYDRELLLRGQSSTGMLDMNTELVRRVHREEKVDVEELWLLLWDGDPETGISPDIRLETVERRWQRVECVRAPWDLID